MNNWKEILEAEFTKDYFKEISTFLRKEYEKYEIYPPKQQVFKAFALCPIINTKVVVLGMDPYHQPSQAHGLSFSVRPGIRIPPSLRNIYKELASDIGAHVPNHGYLKSWAEQGVLLLNSALTVRRGEPGSHTKIWKPFTNSIFKILNEQDKPIVYILWGNFAKSKSYLLTNKKQFQINGVHPSPLSASSGFFGGKYFSRCNDFLIKNNIEPINWKIENI